MQKEQPAVNAAAPGRHACASCAASCMPLLPAQDKAARDKRMQEELGDLRYHRRSREIWAIFYADDAATVARWGLFGGATTRRAAAAALEQPTGDSPQDSPPPTLAEQFKTRAPEGKK